MVHECCDRLCHVMLMNCGPPATWSTIEVMFAASSGGVLRLCRVRSSSMLDDAWIQADFSAEFPGNSQHVSTSFNHPRWCKISKPSTVAYGFLSGFVRICVGFGFATPGLKTHGSDTASWSVVKEPRGRGRWSSELIDNLRHLKTWQIFELICGWWADVWKVKYVVEYMYRLYRIISMDKYGTYT